MKILSKEKGNPQFQMTDYDFNIQLQVYKHKIIDEKETNSLIPVTNFLKINESNSLNNQYIFNETIK